MIIALDFDETFTEDPILWASFILKAKERGHSISFVTYRDARYGNQDIEYESECLGIGIVFTGGKQKQHCFKADIWIDDNVSTIVSYEDMVNMVNGCEVNGDIKGVY